MNTDQFDGHTPGPWLFGRNLNVYDRRGNIVVHVDDLLEGEHDARLIAAAPDLLAEVKRLRKELDGVLIHLPVLEAMRDNEWDVICDACVLKLEVGA